MWKRLNCHNVPNVFDNEYGYGDPVIGWDDLFDVDKCYVKNDMVTLDIKIDVADPNDPNKSELFFKNIPSTWKEDYRKMQLTIKNTASLVAVKSPRLTIKKLPWYLLVYKYKSHLGVGLLLYGDESCTRTMIVKVLSVKGLEKSAEHVQSKDFAAYEEMYTDKCISGDELVKPENGFVNNNFIVLEVTIAGNIEDARDTHRPTAPVLESEREQSKSECMICLEDMKEKGASCIPCGLLFCSLCIKNILKDSLVCPLCRSPAKFSEIRRIYL